MRGGLTVLGRSDESASHFAPLVNVGAKERKGGEGGRCDVCFSVVVCMSNAERRVASREAGFRTKVGRELGPDKQKAAKVRLWK